MSERPILFSGPMVRAILDGRKTQTRRVVKSQPLDGIGTLLGPEWYTPAAEDRHGEIVDGKPIFGIYDSDGEWGCKCPWQPGQKLWLRETWGFEGPRDLDCPLRITYRADDTVRKIDPDSVQWERYENGKGKWRSSIFMPRWASRITLEVTGVRVERVQEISDDDFRYLWNSINGKRPGCAWIDNPWVFAIAFEKR